VSRGEERLEDAKREVESMRGRALVLAGDVADPATTEQAAQKTEQALGPIDVWVNDAMTTVFSPFHEMSAEDFRRVTEVTYLGFVYGTMAAPKRMRSRNRGVIVQVGSALAYRSIPLQSAYCGAKHAIVGFTDSIRSELIHDHSRVHLTVVQMPALNTPQFSWCKSNMRQGAAGPADLSTRGGR
jgi:NAD(P)-dependent dehydrogenase (short-subunit alcohol dehydrogenase family)